LIPKANPIRQKIDRDDNERATILRTIEKEALEFMNPFRTKEDARFGTVDSLWITVLARSTNIGEFIMSSICLGHGGRIYGGKFGPISKPARDVRSHIAHNLVRVRKQGALL
jgi:hypothetical protein